jgi:hypothetical protein
MKVLLEFDLSLVIGFSCQRGRLEPTEMKSKQNAAIIIPDRAGRRKQNLRCSSERPLTDH